MQYNFDLSIVSLHAANKLQKQNDLYCRLRGYTTFSCSTQLSTKFILLINVKMPTIVGIFTSISMINTTSEILNAQVTHSRTGRRISHGYNPASFVAIRIDMWLSVLHP